MKAKTNKEKELLKAVNKFNRIMQIVEDLNVLHLSEDGKTYITHDGEFKARKIKDLVKESEYQLYCYYEGGHCKNELKYDDNKEWHRQVLMLTRFINNHKNKE